MFTWTGKGVVVLLIVLGLMFPVAFSYVYWIEPVLTGHGASFDENPWLLASFYLLTIAIATYPLGRIWLKEPERWTLLDPKTGELQTLVTEHTAYGVGMKYMAPIFAGGFAICLLAGLTKLGGLF